MNQNQENGEFKSTVETLFSGMESFLTSKTVVGDPITVGDTIILPLVNVSFGVGAGVFEREKNNNGAGGLGGKMTPNAVIIIQNGSSRLVRIDHQDGWDKLLNLVPDLVNKFTDLGGKNKKTAEEDSETVDE